MTKTTATAAVDLKVGDRIATRDGKFLTISEIDVTAAAVRIRVGRQQYWSRSKHSAIFKVAA